MVCALKRVTARPPTSTAFISKRSHSVRRCWREKFLVDVLRRCRIKSATRGRSAPSRRRRAA
ncbi:unnamed protein product, partial [Amoebophrya sp. A120]|eukprot:GSA120T00000195001.1